jgi:hypothetical protein
LLFALAGARRYANFHPSPHVAGHQVEPPPQKENDMKKTLSTYEIADLLTDDENANWSRAGAFALAEYLEDIEAVTGQEMEFDVVAIRCDFAEYSSLQDWAIEHFGGVPEALEGLGVEDETELDELEDAIRSYVQDRGTLIEFDGGVIVSSF